MERIINFFKPKFLGSGKITVKEMLILVSLIAMAVVLKMLVIYFTQSNRLVFHNIPIMIASMLFGPFWGVVSAAIADGSSAIYTPGWDITYFIPQILWGLIPGLLMYLLRKWNLFSLIIIEVITHLCVSTANTISMGLTRGWDYAFGKVPNPIKVGFSPGFLDWSNTWFIFGEFIYVRIVFVIIIMLIKIPIDVIILRAISNRVLKYNFNLIQNDKLILETE